VAHRDEYTVFVSQIHPKVDERDLFEFFSHVGRVEDIRLIRDSAHKSKGLCYVEFWERESINKALALAGQLIGGHPINVAVVQNTQVQAVAPTITALKLYIGSLHEDVVEEDLKPVFEVRGSFMLSLVSSCFSLRPLVGWTLSICTKIPAPARAKALVSFSTRTKLTARRPCKR
jgi:RNA-binding protein 39